MPKFQMDGLHADEVRATSSLTEAPSGGPIEDATIADNRTSSYQRQSDVIAVAAVGSASRSGVGSGSTDDGAATVADPDVEEQSGRWPTDDSQEKTPVPDTLLLGRYRVRRVLGRGAMGVVLQAWDDNLARDVAIKLMARELRARAEMVDRFSQEAKALAKLRHTNIVGIFDQLVEQGTFYLVMEFVEGESLAERLANRTVLPPQEACGMVAQLCDGLAYAHSRNIIHRDIKPANVFVTPDGIPKLGDFGLAKITHDVVIRRTEVRGTPAYMAPEQVRGRNVTNLVDVYAMASLAYKLFAGRTPFVEGNLLYAQMHNDAPLVSEFAPQVPEPIVLLLQQALSKNPDTRPSAEEMARAFRKFS